MWLLRRIAGRTAEIGGGEVSQMHHCGFPGCNNPAIGTNYWCEAHQNHAGLREEITRLRALVAVKDKALRKVVEFSYGKCVFCREAALAGLEKE